MTRLLPAVTRARASDSDNLRRGNLSNLAASHV